jgi:hypothetical protein
MARPSLSDIRSLLRQESALLVHFSGLANSSEHYYPSDMLHVTANPHEDQCCSSVRAGMTYEQGYLWGRVGLILDPAAEESVSLVSPSDAGTSKTGHERSGFASDGEFTLDTCKAALSREGGHDEWVVSHFTVRGVFVCPPPEVRVSVPSAAIPGADDIPPHLRCFLGGSSDVHEPVTVSAIRKDLGLPIFAFYDGRLVTVDGDGRMMEVAMDSVYPPEPS